MTDNLNKAQRKKNMKAIKSVSRLEEIVSSEVWKRGIRYRRNTKSLFGKPDISIKKYKVVIFIDSCFWHVCPFHGNIPKTNREFWEKKLMRNKERDIEVTNYYNRKGWYIKRIWEHEIKKDLSKAVDSIVEFIESAKQQERS